MKDRQRDGPSLREEVGLLENLRSARALILRDSESFHEASTLLEHIGQILSGQIRGGLGQYQREIIELACRNPAVVRGQMERLFNVVRNARNMAVHQGAWARHLNTRLVDLFLVLEEAIVSAMTHVEDLMVRTPVAAYGWQRVADVRKAMLANSFSAIPLQSKTGEWRLLSDTAVVRMLNGAHSTAERNRLLAMRIDSAIEQGLIHPDLPTCCRPTTLISEVVPKMNNLPILVVEGEGDSQRLVGILTAFDLL
jgi:CBS domain-containing protein